MRLIESEADLVSTPTNAIRVRRPWQRSVLSFLVAFGPGLIVMEADNDASAVSNRLWNNWIN